MLRALFVKTGNAIWISHLDLMRLFQRGFKRAGLSLKHTQGFNPRPSVSIALPLSVGIESQCELLDFELEGSVPTLAEVRERLNAALIDGVHVLQVYEAGRKVRELAFLEAVVTLEYDHGIPAGAVEALHTLFSGDRLIVEKKGKNGITDVDIRPLVRRLSVHTPDTHTVAIRALICCQNPGMNPMQLAMAVNRYLPDYRPDFARSQRVEIYDAQETVFR